MLNAYEVISDVGESFGKEFNRDYSEYGEDYLLDDADVVFVQMGSSFGTVKKGVETLRKEGIKAGILRIRMFRPFPSEYIRQLLKNAKTVLVMDRTSPAGGEGGPLFMEIRSAMYEGKNHPTIIPFIYGLGSKDFNPGHVVEMCKFSEKVVKGEEEVFAEESVWVNLR